ncbi:MAG: hypothetical protein J1F71_05090 [Clostridiales bacterium]|nr:hypothetical protein [Clostridiales bacterium]
MPETPDVPHDHTYSTFWSTDSKHHWHDPLCDDTTEVKDKEAHSFMGPICSVCFYNKLSETSKLPQTDFKDVGEKFGTVAAPLYNAAETILSDLAESGDVVLNESRNPGIIGIRYCYGRSFEIIIREDVLVNAQGEKSEFLQLETGISLENFGESYDDCYLAYITFLRAERKSQSVENYEEFILPYAEKSARMILAQYDLYKNHKEIRFLNFGKQIILSKESSLSEVYNKIVANLNSALELRGYPLITNQDLTIGFGGNIYWDIVYRWINIDVNVGNLRYSFYISFNENGEFSESMINYFTGTSQSGYTPSDPDLLNPSNEEYPDFFNRLKIEKIDLSDIADSYKYDGEGNALYGPGGEDTFLYF